MYLGYQRLHLTKAVAAFALLTLSGCVASPVTTNQQPAPAAATNNYSLTGRSLCGTVLTLGATSDSSAAGATTATTATSATGAGSDSSTAGTTTPTTLTLTAQAAVCGGGEAGKPSTWRAIGMSVTTAQVYLRTRSDTSYATSEFAPSALYVDAQNNIYAAKSGQPVPIGTLSVLAHGYPIATAPGVKVSIGIADHLYQLTDSHSTPTAERAIWIETGG